MEYTKRIDRDEAYAILGLEKSATNEEIKSAFRRLSMVCHPDKGGTNQLFLIVKTAKDLLLEFDHQTTNASHQEEDDFASTWNKRTKGRKPTRIELINQPDFAIPVQTMVKIMRTNEPSSVYYRKYCINISPEEILQYHIPCTGTVEIQFTRYGNPLFRKLKLFQTSTYNCKSKIKSVTHAYVSLASSIQCALRPGYYTVTYKLEKYKINMNIHVSLKQHTTNAEQSFNLLTRYSRMIFNASIQAHSATER